MATKKTDNILALAPLPSGFDTATSVSLAPWNSRRPRNQDEKRLIDEAYKRQLAMNIIGTQERFGESKIAEIHRHASQVFDETTGFILEVKDQPGRSPQHQACVEQFCLRQVQLYAQQSFALIDVGATGIALEVHRDPYPPPEPERRHGFLERLLGS